MLFGTGSEVQQPESDCFIDSREVMFCHRVPADTRWLPAKTVSRPNLRSGKRSRRWTPYLFTPLVSNVVPMPVERKLEGMHVSRVERYPSATHCQRPAGVRGRLCKLAAAVVSGGARLRPVASGRHRDDHSHRIGIAHVCHWTPRLAFPISVPSACNVRADGGHRDWLFCVREFLGADPRCSHRHAESFEWGCERIPTLGACRPGKACE